MFWGSAANSLTQVDHKGDIVADLQQRLNALGFDAGKVDAKGTISAAELLAAGVVRKSKDGVRLMNKGDVTAKLTLDVAYASKGAIEAVEKAGGSVAVAEKKERVVGKGRRRDRKSAERKAKYAAAMAGEVQAEETDGDE